MEEPPPFVFPIHILQNDNFITDLFILLILIVFSGMISGAEVAFFSLSRKDIEHLKEEDILSSRIIISLLIKSKRLLAVILIVNNAINIAIVLLFSSANFFKNLNDVMWFGFISSKFLIEIGLIAFIILIFGEIIPKIYAKNHNISFSRFMSWPLYVLDIIFRPLSEPLRMGSEYLQKCLGKDKTNISVTQLSYALELTSEGDTTKQEKKMFEDIVSFSDTEAKQIMKPRIDIFAVNEDMKFTEIIKRVTEHNFSRIPIYADNSDNITGILYSKDLLEHIDKKNFNWLKIKREAYFVPENKKIDDLLKEFQQKKIHLAIVVDEYGGTSGLVTLEDVIEEILGDILDESDNNDILHTKIDNNNLIFEGKTTLLDFYRVIGVDEESEQIFEKHKGDSETLAGFILEISGIFPRKKDEISFKNYTFKIIDTDEKRIKKIKVTILHSTNNAHDL